MDALLALDSLTANSKTQHNYALLNDSLTTNSKTAHNNYALLSDSSLSPTLSPPPSFSRLPPDGHEFPQNYQEPSSHFNVGVPALIEMDVVLRTDKKSDADVRTKHDVLPPASAAPPPPLPSSSPPQRRPSARQEADFAPQTPGRKFSTSSASSVDDVSLRSPSGRSAASWRKDEKSERSVRDKIAMFSTSQDEPQAPEMYVGARRLSKHNSSDNVFSDNSDSTSGSLPAGKLLSRSALSVDKVGQPYRSTSSSSAQPSINPYIRKVSPVYNSMSDVSKVPSGTHLDINKNGSPRSLDYASRTQSSLDLTSSSSAYSSGSPDVSLSATLPYSSGYSSTLPRKLPNNNISSPVKTPGAYDNNPNRNGAAALSRTTSFSAGGPSNLHTRSRSLVDVGSAASKRNSVGGYRTTEDMRQGSLNALMENRRRGFSKLRGLVIPEKVAESAAPSQPIFDLPEIKSRESILTSKAPIKDNHQSSSSRNTWNNKWSSNVNSNAPTFDKTKGNAAASANLMSSPPWKSQATVSNLPKYSPAFKRKSLALYGVPSTASSVSSSLSSSREELRPIFDNNPIVPRSIPPLPPSKPPRHSLGNISHYSTANSGFLAHPDPPKSLESITSPTRSDLSFEFVSSSGSSPDLRVPNNNNKDDLTYIHDRKNRNGKNINGDHIHGSKTNRLSPVTKSILSPDTGRSEEDSDNDSAVSSSRSSISHGFSPPQSPLPDNQHRSDDQHHPILSNLPSSGSGNRPLRRTLSSETTASIASSTTSTLTSGSHASCSSNAGSSGSESNRRVLKAQSVEAINRKNVLSSARYSSGKDLKVGSPLIKRKFNEDNEPLENDMDINHEVSLPEEAKDLDGHHKELIKNNSGHENVDLYTKYPSSEQVTLENNVTRKSKDINCRTYVSDNVEPGMSIDIYLTSQETGFLELHSDVADSKEIHDFSCNEVKSEDEEALLPMLVPQPAPRRTSIPSPIKKIPCTDGTDAIVDDDRWTDLQKKYTSNPEPISECNVEAQISRVESEQPNGMIEFQVDLHKESSALRNSGRRLSSDNTSSTDVLIPEITRKTVEVPMVPPKPIQRRNSKVSVQQPESEDADKTLTEADLMSILTGKASNDQSISLRERRRSKDIEALNPVSKTTERNPIPSDTLTNGSSCKSSETLDHESQSNVKVPITATRNNASRRSVSVNDIRKAFEKAELALANTGRSSADAVNGKPAKVTANSINNNHARVSSLDSTTSDDSYIPNPCIYGSVSNLQREQFGSVNSIASTTSLISQQELQSLIDEANQVLEEGGGSSPPVFEVLVVVLHREVVGHSIGITLAGGADYEAKEITVHKVLTGSPADRDGRIQKGDRILSINGRSMKGVTHRESLNILKAHRSEVVLVVSRCRPDGEGPSGGEELLPTGLRSSLPATNGRPPRILEQPAETMADSESIDVTPRGPPVTITLVKDGAGLGFSLEGGKDSPLGDKPLTIKKIFTGGSAEKNGSLKAGDELLLVNGADVGPMSRIEAWGLMKKLSDGNVVLTIRHKVANGTA